MSGLNTKDVKTGGGMPKTITPGEHTLKINNLELKRFPFMEQDNGYFLVLNVETAPIEGFEGFFIDKDDESKGRYEGQIGQIKTNRFYYKDGETKSGIPVNRDEDLLRVFKNLCLATDTVEWFESISGKYETIEDMVAAINAKAPFANKFLNICVAGKEFERNNGFTGYDLFLPKLSRGKFAYEMSDANPSKLLQFDSATHWEKLAPKAVAAFGDAAPGIPDPLAAATPAADAGLGEGAPEFVI